MSVAGICETNRPGYQCTDENGDSLKQFVKSQSTLASRERKRALKIGG